MLKAAGGFDAIFAATRSWFEYYQVLGRDLARGYLDAIPKYLVPFASYCFHTGDDGYFTPERRQLLREVARRIPGLRAAQRDERLRASGLYGVLDPSGTMDNGSDYLLVDNFAALHGLAAYRWLCARLGDQAEEHWAQQEMEDLNACLNVALQVAMTRRGCDYYNSVLLKDQHPSWNI